MNCPSCGKRIPEGSKFCSGCGKKIEGYLNDQKAERSQGETAVLDRKIAELESKKIKLKTELAAAQKKDPESLLKEKEKRLRTDISQLKLVERQQERVLPYQTEQGERYFLTLQSNMQNDKAEKENSDNEKLWLVVCTILSVVAILAFFMKWVKLDFLSWKLAELVRYTEKPWYLLAFIAPILYVIEIFMLWSNQNFEDADGYIKAAFLADIVVVAITFLACLGASGGSDMTALEEAGAASVDTGVWVALLAGIGSYVSARIGENNANEKKSDPSSTLFPKKEQFHVPVVNYNALFECRPLKVTVDGDGKISVDFRAMPAFRR